MSAVLVNEVHGLALYVSLTDHHVSFVGKCEE